MASKQFPSTLCKKGFKYKSKPPIQTTKGDLEFVNCFVDISPKASKLQLEQPAIHTLHLHKFFGEKQNMSSSDIDSL